MIGTADEGLHEPGAQAHWQESWYFNWADPDGRTFGLTRIGVNFAARRIDGVVLTIRDGKAEYVYPGVGLPVGDALRADVSDGLRAGALTYTMREPFKEWHIALRGRNELDLTWTAFTPVYDFHEGLEAAGHDGDIIGAQAHIEQSGRVEGRMRLHGREHEFSGLGHRDKSWGVRDWGGIEGWEWISAQFGPDLTFNATIAHGDGKHVPAGFVHRDGVNYPVRSVSIDYDWARPHIPRGARVTITDADGARYEIRAEALGQVPLYKKGLYIQESHARFHTTVDGVERQGVGVLEHTWHAGLRGALARAHRVAPVVALAVRGRRS